VVTLVCLLLVAGVGWFVVYPEGRAVSDWRQALRAIDEGDFGRARALLERCLEVWPESGETHFLLARTCRRDGDLASARTHLQAARRLGWVQELIDLETLLLRAQSGDVPPVEAELRALLTRGHRDAGLIVEALVIGWLEENFLDDAYRLTALWLNEHPDDWQIRFLRGRVLEAGLRHDLAAEEYGRVLQQKPDHLLAHLRRAEVLFWKGRFREALPHWQRYLEQKPYDADALVGLARCQRVLEPPAVTGATVQRLLSAYPDHPGGCLLRGLLELDEGHDREALPWLQRAEAQGPPDQETLQALATVLRHLGRPQESQAYERRGEQLKKDLQRMDALTKEIIAHPQQASLRYEAGVTLLRLGRGPEAGRWLASVLLLEPNHEAAKKALADYVQTLRDPRRAAASGHVGEHGD
jgi:tetratricopeptide (TPR) repeat protein